VSIRLRIKQFFSELRLQDQWIGGLLKKPSHPRANSSHNLALISFACGVAGLFGFYSFGLKKPECQPYMMGLCLAGFSLSIVFVVQKHLRGK